MFRLGHTVTSEPPGLVCPSGCMSVGASFDTGTVVTLTATPNAGSEFTRWSGCNQTQTNTSTVVMTAAKQVTSTFAKSTNFGFLPGGIYLPLLLD
jgi:hypothetical protein